MEKEQLIKKHLGINTPDWVVQNCIKMLNEFEDIALTIPVVSRSLVSKKETDIMAKDYVKIMVEDKTPKLIKQQRYMDYKNGLENMQEVIECLT